MSKKALTKEQYVNFISTLLGGQTVDLELSDKEIGNLVDIALLKVKPYIGTTKLMTVNSSDAIDLSSKDVYAVINVYRGSPIDAGEYTFNTDSDKSDDTILFSPSLFNYTNNLLGLSSVDSIAITTLTNQVINQAYGRSGDIDFDYDSEEEILYVDTGNSGTDALTIEYIPNYDDVSQISEPFWINFILNYAVALTKIALGRARSKYRLNDLPYEMDGDTLLQEGNQELENLQNDLKELDDLNYFLD